MAAVLTVLWYLGVWLLYYRGKGGVKVEPLPHRWQEKVDTVEESLLGATVPEPGSKVVSADDFGFVPDQHEQLGPVADLQQEIRLACRELESQLAVKSVFLDRFAELIKAYPPSEELKGPIAEFIREQVPFFIDDEEIDRIGL